MNSGQQQQSETPCQYVHKVNGVVPGMFDLQYDGKVCDCGRIKFIKEHCGCQNNPHDELKSKPNEG